MNQFNWEGFYDVGNHLKNYSKKESYQRSAICRYYYSCFGPVKGYYEKTFRKTLSKNDAHSTLINLLIQSPFFEEKELGEKLKDLRKNRNYADYNPKKLNKTMTSESKIYAEEIFKILDGLHKNPLRLMKN